MGRVRWSGPIEPMPWGKRTYTVIRLPEAAVRGWRSEGVKRLSGTIDGCEVDLAITTAPVLDGAFVWAGSSLLRRIQAEPGDVVDIELGPADPDEVRLPADVAGALRSAGALARWEALTPGRRRGLLYRVESARTTATRAARIATLVDDLSRGG